MVYKTYITNLLIFYSEYKKEAKSLSSKNIIFNIETRRNIYIHIKKNPGLYQRELSRTLKLPYTTLMYHLRHLLKRDLLSEKKNNGYSRYYLRNSIGLKEKKVVDLFRQKIPKSMIIFMMYAYVSTEKDLSENLDRHPATIKYHLEKLLELDIIEYAPVENNQVDNKLNTEEPIITRRPVKNERFYRIKDRALIERAMTILEDTLLKDKEFSATYDMCNEYKASHGKPKKIDPFNKAIDEIIDMAYEIFPHPYHA